MKEPNLLSHEILKLLEEGLKAGASRGDAEIALTDGVGRFGKDLSDARVSDYRKLYHEGWTELLARIAEKRDHEWLTDRFKALVF